MEREWKGNIHILSFWGSAPQFQDTATSPTDRSCVFGHMFHLNRVSRTMYVSLLSSLVEKGALYAISLCVFTTQNREVWTPLAGHRTLPFRASITSDTFMNSSKTLDTSVWWGTGLRAGFHLGTSAIDMIWQWLKAHQFCVFFGEKVFGLGHRSSMKYLSQIFKSCFRRKTGTAKTSFFSAASTFPLSWLVGSARADERTNKVNSNMRMKRYSPSACGLSHHVQTT